MADERIETLPYSGESPQSRFAFERYMDDVKRGKGALQLKAVAAEMNAELRQNWSARSFTAVSTPEGHFDAIVCNVSYHFHKHGQRFGSITRMTEEATRYYKYNRHLAKPANGGLLKLPNGSVYEIDGRIVTFAA
jgi:hypothetical protein